MPPDLQPSPRSSNGRIKVLVCAGHYLPGYKAGGPVRSIANLVAALGDEFDFRVITQDHDLGDTRPYPGVPSDVWTTVGKARVMYLSSRGRSLARLAALYRQTPCDLLYLNSLCCRPFSVLPLMLRQFGWMPRVPVIVAPRGEVAPAALAHHRLRKSLYLAALRSTGIANQVLWQASSVYERRQLEDVLGAVPHISQVVPLPETRLQGRRGAPRTIVAPDAPGIDMPPPKAEPTGQPKDRGHLRVVYLARVHPHKNLHYALSLLPALRGTVRFRIYGPIEDRKYWQRCRTSIAALPPNIAVEYGGHVDHSDTHRLLRENDLFLLPTQSENFGHSILEALCAGRPVLIADTTPWRNLEEKGVGWDLPLAEPQRFQAILQHLIDMDGQTFAGYSTRAQQYGVERSNDPEVLEQNRQLFTIALRGRKAA